MPVYALQVTFDDQSFKPSLGDLIVQFGQFGDTTFFPVFRRSGDVFNGHGITANKEALISVQSKQYFFYIQRHYSCKWCVEYFCAFVIIAAL